METRWLPIAFRFTSTEGLIDWLRFSTLSLSEPFFSQSIAKLKATSTLRRVGPFEELTALAGNTRPVTPAGLVFHISRCGSTLLSNVLRHAERTIVLSEAEPVYNLLGPDPQSGYFPGRESGRRLQLLRDVATLYSYDESDHPFNLVIKCHAINLLNLRLGRVIWPAVPQVALIRDPVEVITSMLREPGGFMSFQRCPSVAAGLFGLREQDIPAMGPVEFCSRIVGVYLAAIVAEESIPVIDYSSLTTATVYRIAAAFGLKLPACDSGVVGQTFRMYSKDVNGGRIFVDDRATKHALASDAIRDAASRWARGNYEKLIARASTAPLMLGKDIEIPIGEQVLS